MEKTLERERRQNFELRKMIDLTVSECPAGNVHVTQGGLWIVFRERGNVHVYPGIGIIEVNREGALENARILAEAYRREGYGVYEVRMKE